MRIIQNVQLAINDAPELKGNVKAFRTDVLVDKAAADLYPTARRNQERGNFTHVWSRSTRPPRFSPGCCGGKAAPSNDSCCRQRGRASIHHT